jgi:hypothetical protein
MQSVQEKKEQLSRQLKLTLAEYYQTQQLLLQLQSTVQSLQGGLNTLNDLFPEETALVTPVEVE